jgi:hypothetical protein
MIFMVANKKIGKKGISHEILWIIVLLFILLIFIAVIYAGGLRLIQDYLQQNIIK